MDLVRKTKVSHGKPAERLHTRLGMLFDISSVTRAPEPPEDAAFLVDQRSARNLSIGPIDTTTTRRWRRRESRQARETCARATSQAATTTSQPSSAVCGPRAAAQTAARAMSAVPTDMVEGDESDAGHSSVTDGTSAGIASAEASACCADAADDPDYVPPRPQGNRKTDLRPWNVIVCHLLLFL